MKLKYLSALVFGVVLSLPVQAQVYLDRKRKIQIVLSLLLPQIAILVGRRILLPDWMVYSEVRF